MSVGNNGDVWGVNSGDNIYYRNGVNGNWQHIGGKLKYVSVGGDSGQFVWGVNVNNDIYFRAGLGGGWQHIGGKLMQIEVDNGGVVQGVNGNHNIYTRNGVGGGWQLLGGLLKHVAAGAVVWGVNSNNQIYHNNDGVNCAAAPVCNGIQVKQFAGEVFTVSQTSSYHGRAQYTYVITVGGRIDQQTSDAGNYYLGSHVSYGDMTESFANGDRCGSTPRSATVTYVVGPTMALLEANEPSMCVYTFKIQLPESKCNLPMTPVTDLDTNDEGVDEQAEELQDEDENVHECKKWCYSKKHKNKAWKQPGDPFKCGWFGCSACPECN